MLQGNTSNVLPLYIFCHVLVLLSSIGSCSCVESDVLFTLRRANLLWGTMPCAFKEHVLLPKWDESELGLRVRCSIYPTIVRYPELYRESLVEDTTWGDSGATHAES
jgi:hypothetical protein